MDVGVTVNVEVRMAVMVDVAVGSVAAGDVGTFNLFPHPAIKAAGSSTMKMKPPIIFFTFTFLEKFLESQCHSPTQNSR
jgi:hypothetical protein